MLCAAGKIAAACNRVRDEARCSPIHDRSLLASSLLATTRYQLLREQLAASPKRWLITGVAGFIGSNLLEDLLGLGQTVVGLDNFSTGHRANLSDALSAQWQHAQNFSLIEGDIRDAGTCRRACAGVDYVLHHAALASVPRSISEPAENHAVNVDGFVNMLMAAKDASVSRFVYASSSAVYGDTVTQPQVEARTGKPLSPYAASKAINETYAVAFEMAYQLRTVGLRYFNIFGPRQDPEGAYAAVIPRWISNLLLDLPCVIYGDGETTRDFCHVANVVQANLLAATSLDTSATAEAYNVACAAPLTLNVLYGTMREQLARSLPGVASASPTYEPFRAGDIRCSSASIEKAAQLLGFAPTHSVSAGLQQTIAWYLDQSRLALLSEGGSVR